MLFVVRLMVCSAFVQVDEKEVERLHKTFYDKVAMLFQQHKDSFKGYEKVKLVLIE